VISFILTVLNRPDNLGKFFQYMPKQSLEHEWIVVDNGSEATTKQLEYWLQQRYPNLTLIENEHNEGFAAGNNMGVPLAKGETLVFTQPDVEFKADVTRYIDGTLLDNVLYGHQLLNYDTGWNRFGDVVVPYLTGYFIACTSKTWALLGGFDELYYPADFEDVDLSYKATQLGMPLKVLDVPVSHNHFGSTWSQFPNREKTTKKNRRLFAAKWGFDAT